MNNTLSLDVSLAPLEERQIVRNLMELYQYETSLYQDVEIGPLGLYLYRYFDHYWTEAGRHPFLVHVDQKLAGFVLINQHCLVSTAPHAHTIAEFFILSQYRRRGIGQRVATHLFDLFPGAWEVRQVKANLAAQSFWRYVIADYTAGHFEEVVLNDDRWEGPVQVFQFPGVSQSPTAYR